MDSLPAEAVRYMNSVPLGVCGRVFLFPCSLAACVAIRLPACLVGCVLAELCFACGPKLSSCNTLPLPALPLALTQAWAMYSRMHLEVPPAHGHPKFVPGATCADIGSNLCVRGAEEQFYHTYTYVFGFGGECTPTLTV